MVVYIVIVVVHALLWNGCSTQPTIHSSMILMPIANITEVRESFLIAIKTVQVYFKKRDSMYLFINDLFPFPFCLTLTKQ